MKTLQPNTQSNSTTLIIKFVSAVFTMLLLTGFNNSAAAQSTFASRHAVQGLEPLDWKTQQEANKVEETTASLVRPKLTAENGKLKIVNTTQSETVASSANAFNVAAAAIADPDADPDFQPAAAINGTAKAAQDVFGNQNTSPAAAKKH